jgi:hypothetical protein
MDTLSGAVERITYYNAENRYTALRLRPDTHLGQRLTNKSTLNSEGLATVVGNLPELSPGEHLLCRLFKSSAQILEAKQREAVDNPELYTI